MEVSVYLGVTKFSISLKVVLPVSEVEENKHRYITSSIFTLRLLFRKNKKH